VSLQLSLHAPTTPLREQIIQTLIDVKRVVKATQHWAKIRGEKVTVNYLLLKDFNDSYKAIDQLMKLLDPRFFRIMFSHLNPVTTRDFPYSESAKFAILKEYVAEKGYEVTEFDDIGKQAGAGCGQLSSS
jgi:23S rRNA (adenine2503-C2)-methyltransferase